MQHLDEQVKELEESIAAGALSTPSSLTSKSPNHDISFKRDIGRAFKRIVDLEQRVQAEAKLREQMEQNLSVELESRVDVKQLYEANRGKADSAIVSVIAARMKELDNEMYGLFIRNE